MPHDRRAQVNGEWELMSTGVAPNRYRRRGYSPDLAAVISSEVGPGVWGLRAGNLEKRAAEAWTSVDDKDEKLRRELVCMM